MVLIGIREAFFLCLFLLGGAFPSISLIGLILLVLFELFRGVGTNLLGFCFFGRVFPTLFFGFVVRNALGDRLSGLIQSPVDGVLG